MTAAVKATLIDEQLKIVRHDTRGKVEILCKDQAITNNLLDTLASFSFAIGMASVVLENSS